MRRLFLIAAVVATLYSCTADKGYSIKGQFIGCKSDSVWLWEEPDENTVVPVILASAPCVDGNFSFKGETDVPVLALITDFRPVNVDDAPDDFQHCEVVVEPGQMVMSAVFDSLYVMNGTKANDAMAVTRKKVYELRNLVQEIMANGGAVTDEYVAMVDDYQESLKSSLKDNLDNLYGLILLEGLDSPDDPESTKTFLEKFPDNLKKTSNWKRLNERVENRMKLGVGKPYLDFTQNDPDGNPVTASKVMSDPKNRYVLIDFWASWCGPCMSELPYLKQAYNMYSPMGFEIIGVSLDREREPWLETIKNEEMNWIHVSDVQYWSNEVARLYNIQSIPANYLVDCKTGLVVAKGLRGAELGRRLADLLR